MPVERVTFSGKHVRLEPMTLEHHAGLCAAGLDPDLWRWTWGQVLTPADMRAYMESALRDQAADTALPFVIVDLASGKVIGSSRFGNIDRVQRRLEIGWTWVSRRWQRTAANTEAKLLLLTHAFEVLGCVRVEFKTDALNEPSRKALLRIGATEEGTFRKHGVTDRGRIRDSVYYSIVDDEWPAAKARLEGFLANPRGSLAV